MATAARSGGSGPAYLHRHDAQRSDGGGVRWGDASSARFARWRTLQHGFSGGVLTGTLVPWTGEPLPCPTSSSETPVEMPEGTYVVEARLYEGEEKRRPIVRPRPSASPGMRPWTLRLARASSTHPTTATSSRLTSRIRRLISVVFISSWAHRCFSWPANSRARRKAPTRSPVTSVGL